MSDGVPNKPELWFCYSCVEDKPIERFKHRFRQDRGHWEIGKFCLECLKTIKTFKQDKDITYFKSAFLCLLDGFDQCLDCQKILPLSEFYFSPGGGQKHQCWKCRKRRQTFWRLKAGRYIEPFSILPGFKKCVGCEEIKAKTEFRFSLKTDDNCYHRCFDCENNIQKMVKDSRETKECGVCGRFKLLKEFCVDKRNKNGIADECRECHAKRVGIYRRNLKKTDAGYNIYSKIRSRIRMALKMNGGVKDRSTLEYTGCSIRFLKQFLLRRFYEGFERPLSWEEFLVGEYDIDHVIPCNAFDFSFPDAINLCFHYTNLRIISSYENGSKNDKLPNNSCARYLMYKIKNRNDLDRVKDGFFPLADLSQYNSYI